MKARRIRFGLALAILIAVTLILPAQSVCRDWAFVDRNTGSRKGYRQWFLGWRSGSWSQVTAIETFMRSNYAAVFRQDWVSYAGTGRNILGRAVLRGHGRPGPIVHLRPEIINEYCRSATDEEKRRLYGVLSSGNHEAIRACVDLISEEVSASKAKTEPR